MGMVKKTRMASGEFEITEYQVTLDIEHNLGSRKIFVVAQRVNENHAEITNTGSRYNDLMLIGFTKECIELDEAQTYSYKTSCAVNFSNSGSSTDIYPFGMYAYFPAETNPAIALTPIGASNREMKAVSDNAVHFNNTGYALFLGRWVWRAYALD